MADARALPPASGARAQYPSRMAVDFTQLQPHALHKYLSFHGIPAPPGSSHEELAVLVARHFGDACARADEARSISSFVSYVTQDGGGLKRRKVADTPSRVAGEEGSERFSGREFDPEDTLVWHDELPARRHRYSDEYDDAEIETFADENCAGNASPDDETLDEHLESSGARRANGSKLDGARGSSATATSKSEPVKKKKTHRKGRLYCVCKGSSFGDMIACDNKKCLDRSNWYHMSCVGLDPLQPPPETWFCPLCRDKDLTDIPENQYRKPVASVTYGDMISHALMELPDGKGTFKEICDFVEKQYESQLNWKLESDQRKSPVWKSSVRKILFSNMRFRKHPEDKGLFCLAA